MNRYHLILALGVAVCAAPVRGQQTPSPELTRQLNEVVARVGTKEIRRRDVAFLMQIKVQQRGLKLTADKIPAFERDALEEIIGRQLLLEEARANEPKDLEAKVGEQLAQAVKQLGGEEKFAQALTETHLTREEYVTQLRETVLFAALMERLLKEQGQATEDEVRKFYEENKAGMRTPEVVALSHILVRLAPDAEDLVRQAKRSQAEAARTLVKSGEKFAAVARKVSEDPNTADNGGALGYFRRGQLPADLEVVAFSLKTNEVSEVIATPAGLHVLTVTDRKPAQQLTLDQVKPQIEMLLRERKGMDYVRQHVVELRQKAKVEVLLPPVPAASTNSMPAPR